MDNFQKRKIEQRMALDDRKAAIESARQQKFMAEHTVAAGETLSHLSLKYYGSAAKEKWMLIYEANKAVIGDDPNKIRAGQVLKIPALPE